MGKQPDIRDVVPEDLNDAERLREPRRQAVEARFISSSEADELAFFAASAHARAVGAKPCRLFAWMVRGRRFEFITQADEDAARALLRPPIPRERERPTPAPPQRLEEPLSADALLARSVLAALARRGYHGGPPPLAPSGASRVDAAAVGRGPCRAGALAFGESADGVGRPDALRSP